MKKLTFLLMATLLCYGAYSQDSSYVRFRSDSSAHALQPSHLQQLQVHAPYYGNQPLTPNVYRDTRLGSSSPQYNTYQKNHYGAGAVTTNPNKWGSGAPVIISQPVLPADTSANVHTFSDRKMTKRDSPA